MEFGAQNQYGRVTYHPFGNFIRSKKNYTCRSQKIKISLQGPKMEFGAQNQYGRVTYPSFGNFIRIKKNYTIRGQKGENRLPEPNNDDLNGVVVSNADC
jgi:hypothetical protein